MTEFPPRLHVLLASRAKVGVVIRRGPSRSVATFLWDRTNDAFSIGQWLRGRIYERRSDLSPTGKRFLVANPHLHYASQRRGYLRCTLTHDAMAVDFRTVPYVTGDADAPVVTDRSFVVEAETPALHAA